MNTKTYTAVYRGYVFVRRGTWEQIQKILADGFCVCRVHAPGSDGVVVVTLGIVL